MHARVSTIQADPSKADEGIRVTRDEIIPRVKALDGFAGSYLLIDRDTGKVVAMTLWESEEALRASEEAANKLRGDSTSAVGGEIVGVERFEVAHQT